MFSSSMRAGMAKNPPCCTRGERSVHTPLLARQLLKLYLRDVKNTFLGRRCSCDDLQHRRIFHFVIPLQCLGEAIGRDACLAMRTLAAGADEDRPRPAVRTGDPDGLPLFGMRQAVALGQFFTRGGALLLGSWFEIQC